MSTLVYLKDIFNEEFIQYEIKNNVRFYRKSYGYTQQQLADMVGVSKNTIYNIESDRNLPAISTLMLILKVFNDPHDLFYLQYVIGVKK